MSSDKRSRQRDQDAPGSGIGGSALESGPFTDEAEHTPAPAWIATGLMTLSAIAFCLAVTAVSWGTQQDVWILVALGGLLGLVGVGLGWAKHIMREAE